MAIYYQNQFRNYYFGSTGSLGAMYYGALEVNPGQSVVPAPAINYLLDDYPSAAFGLSLRKLSSTYSGAAIRIRRSSDNSETDIGFSGGDLDTSAITSFIGAGNGYIRTWYDQSGNARDFYQTTEALQPLIAVAGVVLTITGSGAAHPQIRFDNTQWLQGASLSGYTAASIFTSTRADTTATGGKFFWNFNNDAGGATHHPFTTTDAYEGAFKTNRPQVVTANNSLFSLHIWGITSATNDYKVSQNTTSVYTDAGSSVATSITNPYIGRADGGSSNTCYPGSFQEIVSWFSNQDSNRTGIINNINNYFEVFS